MFQFLIPAAAAIFGASRSSRAAQSAADTSAAATDRATQLQREMFERQTELQEPWRQAGMTALNKLIPMATQYTPFGMQQFQADPGYAFRLSEGMKALERSAAARGGLLSGATMKGIQRYGQDLASQEYQNAFNRYRLEREAALNPLQSLAGVGQTTSQQLGQAGANYATNVGNAMIGQGQTAANAMLARGSAYQRGAGDIASLAGRYYGGYGGYGGGTAPIYQASPSYMPVMDENLP
jgi:hypothetical protein